MIRSLWQRDEMFHLLLILILFLHWHGKELCKGINVCGGGYEERGEYVYLPIFQH